MESSKLINDSCVANDCWSISIYTESRSLPRSLAPWPVGCDYAGQKIDKSYCKTSCKSQEWVNKITWQKTREKSLLSVLFWPRVTSIIIFTSLHVITSSQLRHYHVFVSVIWNYPTQPRRLWWVGCAVPGLHRLLQVVNWGWTVSQDFWAHTGSKQYIGRFGSEEGRGRWIKDYWSCSFLSWANILEWKGDHASEWWVTAKYVASFGVIGVFYLILYYQHRTLGLTWNSQTYSSIPLLEVRVRDAGWSRRWPISQNALDVSVCSGWPNMTMSQPANCMIHLLRVRLCSIEWVYLEEPMTWSGTIVVTGVV